MPFDATPVTNPVIESLRAGRIRIEAGWCTCVGSRRSASGRMEYCAVGAVLGDFEACRSAILYLARSLPPRYWNITKYNDSHTQADVLALYDQAIELAEQDQLENGGK